MENMPHKQMMLSGLLGAIGDIRSFRMQAYNVANYIAGKCENILGGNSKEKILIAIMRAGNAFIPTFTTRMPNAQIHFITAKRDSKTSESEILCHTLKDKASDNTDVILLEPMIATGGTMDKVIDLVNEKLCPKSVTIASAFSSEIAEDRLSGKASIVTFMGGLELNSDNYILIQDPQNPGSYRTFDFGDQFCGTTQ